MIAQSSAGVNLLAAAQRTTVLAKLPFPHLQRQPSEGNSLTGAAAQFGPYRQSHRKAEKK